ncbi:MAG: S1 RNA-binding domain-containing protein, partial [Bacteroidetes bacterium]|nr:S1 RNA-binding domain-containing protein [Bacteroidota bacterium]
ELGKLEHNQTVYPFGEKGNKILASKQIKTLVNSFKIDAIAIGNGTAGRETEDLIKSIYFDRDVKAFVVNEDGASVYSASEVAREEFEKFDLTVRGAVSIGRRLMDPLAELVKIDPKSIGVGQYQHDVDQHMLKSSLDQITESCVNQVGVNLNTASKQLLTYVSGLAPLLAQNIIDYRNINGAFKSRNDLKNVKRMGAKAFEQSAAFLRIKGADNPLDNSAVHPESYFIVEKMAKDLKTDIQELMQSAELQKQIDLNSYVSNKVGLPTLQDIQKELAKPGRDPRQSLKEFEFDKHVRKVEDLHEGMILSGIVSNITNFGAFVDVGVKQDGLVHISELADRFISDPNEVVHLHQQVKIKVLSIDIQRKRLAFSMKQLD